MDAPSDINEWVRQAFASGATGFTLWTGVGTVTCSAKGMHTKDETKRATYAEVEEFLRRHMSSRELRQFRSKGIVHFISVFESHVSVVGWAKLAGDNARVDLCKMAAYPRDLSNRLRRRLAEGRVLDDALRDLRAAGASIIESIAAVELVRGCDVVEAVALVIHSEAWADVDKETEAVKAQFAEALEKDPEQ